MEKMIDMNKDINWISFWNKNKNFVYDKLYVKRKKTLYFVPSTMCGEKKNEEKEKE